MQRNYNKGIGFKTKYCNFATSSPNYILYGRIKRTHKSYNLKMKKELEDRVQKAIDNFMQGYGCCQSVVTAFADLYGMDDNTAKKVGARSW